MHIWNSGFTRKISSKLGQSGREASSLPPHTFCSMSSKLQKKKRGHCVHLMWLLEVILTTPFQKDIPEDNFMIFFKQMAL